MKTRTKIIIGIVIGCIVLGVALFLAANPSWIGEQPSSSNYIHKTIGLISDLPHATAELIFAQIDNIISWFVVAIIVRKYVQKQHEKIDAEHGYVHDKDGQVHKDKNN